MFDLEVESQGHGIQHLQWSHSMANMNLYESHTCAYFASSHISRYSRFKIRDLENIGQGHDVQHSQWHHSMANT